MTLRIKSLDKQVSPATMIGALIGILLVVVFYPLGVIWSLNVLFATEIAFGFYQWLAVIVLSMFINGIKVERK